MHEADEAPSQATQLAASETADGSLAFWSTVLVLGGAVLGIVGSGVLTAPNGVAVVGAAAGVIVAVIGAVVGYAGAIGGLRATGWRREAAWRRHFRAVRIAGAYMQATELIGIAAATRKDGLRER